MRRSLRLPAAAASIAVLATILTYASPGRASIPQPFLTLAQNCASFTKAHAQIRVPSLDEHLLVHLHADGRIGVDRFIGFSSPPSRYVLDEQKLTWSNSVSPQPREVAEAGKIITDLFNECRAGFVNTDWASAAPPAPAPALAETPYARLALPFPWADGTDVYIGLVSAVDSRPLHIVVIGAMDLDIRIDALDWASQFPDMALDPEPPPMMPPVHPRWKTTGLEWKVWED
jgi:hypothetical protein